MHTALLVFEFLGTTELLVIAVVALVLFGPRKLPEIGRTVGKALGEFKRASDDFKRTWEYEVEVERRRPAADTPATDATVNTFDGTAVRTSLPGAEGGAAEPGGVAPVEHDSFEPTVARGAYGDEAAWDVATGQAGDARPREGEDKGEDKDALNAS